MHTPGPHFYDLRTTSIGCGCGWIAMIQHEQKGDGEFGDPDDDGRLYAAAPDLLAACEAAKRRLGDELPPIDLGNHICGTPHADCDMDCMRAQDIGRHNRAVRKIDAAIAKAHGDG